jgi:hypothetical protein
VAQPAEGGKGCGFLSVARNDRGDASDRFRRGTQAPAPNVGGALHTISVQQSASAAHPLQGGESEIEHHDDQEAHPEGPFAKAWR